MKNTSHTAAPRTMWRFYPWFIAAGMSVVVAVNFGMAYTALHTFPGNAGGDGFDLSNHYDAILDHMARQAALGWHARAETDDAGRPVVLLTDQTGAALTGAGIEAAAARPLGDMRAVKVTFSETSAGRYVGASVLDEKGQWDLRLSATAGGREFSTTRRIIVR